MKSDRLFQIVNILIQKKIVTAPWLADELEVSVRTIYRDIDSLSAAGVPVYCMPGKSGGIAIMEDYKIDRSVLSEEERSLILTSLSNLKMSLHGASELVSKLSALFQIKEENWIEVDLTRWGNEEKDQEVYTQVKTAILSHQSLLIKYCSNHGETTRMIDPIKLIYKSKSWYLFAYCQKAMDYRMFKVTRILAVTPGDENFDPEKYAHTDWHIATDSSEEQFMIELRFSANAGFRVYDEFNPSSVTRAENGEFIVHANIPYGDWIYGYLLSFGEEVTVIAPQFVKEHLNQMYCNLAKRTI